MNDQEKYVRVDLLDVLLDENNTAPIYMYDNNGRQLKFEQVAIIPMEEELYCILKPLIELEGVADDEAIVFRVDEDDEGESFLTVETNEKKAMTIFKEYYDLLEEALKAKKKNN